MGMWEASRLAALPRRLGAGGAILLALAACAQGGGFPGGPTPTPTAQATSTPLYQADAIFNRMTDEQRVGQLFLVGIASSDAGPSVLADAISDHHAGGAVLYGPGWSSAERVRTTAGALQGMATRSATAGVRLYIAGSQEGGQRGVYQTFYGRGFKNVPAALDQGAMDPAELQMRARAWGRELVAAGVNLNLAPAMDTVPPDTDLANQPIGAHRRAFGHGPATVASHGAAFVRGMEAAGVSVAEKDFPGMGRLSGDPTTVATGITDAETTSTDDYLQPYQAGWEAGAEMVTVALAHYPAIDPSNLAVFSP